MPVKERELSTRRLVVVDLGPWVSYVVHLHYAVTRSRELVLVVWAVLDVLDLIRLVSELESWLLHARVPQVDPLVSAAAAYELVGLQLVPRDLRLSTVFFIFLSYISLINFKLICQFKLTVLFRLCIEIPKVDFSIWR